ncbi:8360_t:CDS:2, partial [Scutellospora calospora]
IGLSGAYVTTKTWVPYKISVEPTYLPRNEYHMFRAWGYYLISVYTIGVLCIFISIAYTIVHKKIYGRDSSHGFAE